MKKEDIIKEARKRHPKTKPMHYLTEGQAMGFIEGALWMKAQCNRLPDHINQALNEGDGVYRP